MVFVFKPQRALIFHPPECEEQHSTSPLGTPFEYPCPISSFMVGLGPVTEVDPG